AVRPSRHPGEQRRHVAARAIANRDHRGAVRQGHRHQLQGPVPALGAGRRQDDGRRRWRDHPALEYRVIPADAAHHSLCRSQGGDQRDDGGAREALRSEDPRELHLPWAVPDRRVDRLARRQGGAAAPRPQALRQSERDRRHRALSRVGRVELRHRPNHSRRRRQLVVVSVERVPLFLLVGVVATTILGWAVLSSIRTGNTWGGLMFGMVYRDRNPIIFWVHVGTYAVFWLAIMAGVVEGLTGVWS